MPIYEYQCDGCDRVMEFKYMVADRPESIWCAGCGGTMKQIISLPAMVGVRRNPNLNKWAYAQEDGGTETVG